VLLACVGGGCNSLGLFTAFLDDPAVKLVGVEPAGHGLDKGLGQHSATLTLGTDGVIHGMSTICLMDEQGAPAPVHSCASGLDYPGIGPQHAWMKHSGRVQYETATDKEVTPPPHITYFKLLTYYLLLGTYYLRLTTYDLRLTTYDLRLTTYDL
jgi:tryptophan synthase beta subunit